MYFVFWDRVSHWPRILWISLDYWAGSISLFLGTAGTLHLGGFLTRVPWVRLRSLPLWSKHFTYLPSPNASLWAVRKTVPKAALWGCFIGLPSYLSSFHPISLSVISVLKRDLIAQSLRCWRSWSSASRETVAMESPPCFLCWGACPMMLPERGKLLVPFKKACCWTGELHLQGNRKTCT